METATSLDRNRALACLERLPRLSPMMMRLLAKLARPHCEARELASLIEKDPLLTGQVLSMANSAAFGRAQQIATVGHAVTMVGVGTLRRFALASSISNLFKTFRFARSFSLARFNQHSVATAMLTEELVIEVRVDFPEGAFIAGILHDIGKLLIAASLPDSFETIVSLSEISDAPLIECERQVLGFSHAELSASAIQRWELAAEIQQAARFHHEPDLATRESNPGVGKVSLALVISKADAFVNSMGMSLLSSPAAPNELASLDLAGFPYSQERVLRDFQREWKTVGDCFR